MRCNSSPIVFGSFPNSNSLLITLPSDIWFGVLWNKEPIYFGSLEIFDGATMHIGTQCSKFPTIHLKWWGAKIMTYFMTCTTTTITICFWWITRLYKVFKNCAFMWSVKTKWYHLWYKQLWFVNIYTSEHGLIDLILGCAKTSQYIYTSFKWNR